NETHPAAPLSCRLSLKSCVSRIPRGDVSDGSLCRMKSRNCRAMTSTRSRRVPASSFRARRAGVDEASRSTKLKSTNSSTAVPLCGAAATGLAIVGDRCLAEILQPHRSWLPAGPLDMLPPEEELHQEQTMLMRAHRAWALV